MFDLDLEEESYFKNTTLCLILSSLADIPSLVAKFMLWTLHVYYLLKDKRLSIFYAIQNICICVNMNLSIIIFF